MNICVHVHISTCVCVCIYNRHVHIHILNTVYVIYLEDFLRRYTKIFTESITGISLFFSFLFSNTVNSHEVVQQKNSWHMFLCKQKLHVPTFCWQ